MGFKRSAGGGGNYPDLPAEIVNIGIDYQEYKDGKAQHRIVVVYQPTKDDSPLGMQTNMLNTSNSLKVEGRKRTITVGASASAFELELVGDIVTGGEIGGKAKVWLDKWEKLGFPMKDLENSGDFNTFIGVEAELRQMTYSEAIGRKQDDNSEYAEKPFWMPVKILKMPKKQKSLDEEVLEFAGGRTEDNLIDWAKDTGKKMSDVFGAIDKAIAAGKIVKDEDTYVVKGGK